MNIILRITLTLFIWSKSMHAQVPAMSAPTRPSSNAQLCAPTRPPVQNTSAITLQGVLKATPHAFNLKPDYDYELRNPSSKARLAWLIMGEAASLQPLSAYIGKNVQLRGINIATASSPYVILKVERIDLAHALPGS